jgi:hypothetical protein
LLLTNEEEGGEHAQLNQKDEGNKYNRNGSDAFEADEEQDLDIVSFATLIAQEI